MVSQACFADLFVTGLCCSEGSQFLPPIPDKSPEHGLDAALAVTLQDSLLGLQDLLLLLQDPNLSPRKENGEWDEDCEDGSEGSGG